MSKEKSDSSIKQISKTIINSWEENLKLILYVLIFLSIGYYQLVWQKIGPDADGGHSKQIWITVVSLVVIMLILGILFRKKSKVVETTGNYAFIIVIILGVILFSIYFSNHEQSVWVKLFAIAYFSFIPAWLYLDFIYKKGLTLWEEYVLNLYRLSIDTVANLPRPPENSVFYTEWQRANQDKKEDHKSIYQKKFEGLFGMVPIEQKDAAGKSVFSKFRGDNLLAVAIVTVLISFGWVLVTEPESLFGINIFPVFESNNRPLLPLETFRFAFLGSYFYILQMLVRRYFQNDLKTSAYISCILRIIVVMLLVWALDMVSGNTISQANRSLIAFIIGVFPMVGWQAIQAAVKFPLKKTLLPSLEQKFPLNELDGLNIWYESRLLEEGIEDMQNLTTANIVDVMLNTRIPVERLIDWMDQSILYLHLGDGENDKNGGFKKDRQIIRRYGIRTATDLEDVFNMLHDEHVAEHEDKKPGKTDKEFLQKLEMVLNHGDAKEGPSILRSILASFKKEPNLDHIRCWRSFSVKSRAAWKEEDQ